MDFVLDSTLVRPCTAYYVISVRRFGSLPAKIPHPGIRLPSDSTSRWTPLPSANASYCRARSGLSPPSCCPCRAHYQKTGSPLRGPVFCCPKSGNIHPIANFVPSEAGQQICAIFACLSCFLSIASPRMLGYNDTYRADIVPFGFRNWFRKMKEELPVWVPQRKQRRRFLRGLRWWR